MKMMSDFFELHPIGIIIWTTDGKIYQTNQALRTLIHFSSQPEKMEDICHLVDLNKELSLLAPVLNNEKKYRTYSKNFYNHDLNTKFETDVMTFLIREDGKEYLCSNIRRSSFSEIKKREETLEFHNSLIFKLTKEINLEEQTKEEIFKLISEMSVDGLDCARTGIWFFNPEKTELNCVNLFEKTTQSHSSGDILLSTEYPNYFRYIEEELALSVFNASLHAKTAEFKENYLKPKRIVSMLDTAIRLNGKVIGILCHETVDKPKIWRTEEKTFSCFLADFISKVVEGDQKKAIINELEITKTKFQEKFIEHNIIIRKANEDKKRSDEALKRVLINPLNQNLNTARKVKTDFVIQQFINVENELIGGDYCMTDSIYLDYPKDKYIFFTNMDIEGIGYQGAVGGLIVGAALNSILDDYRNPLPVANKNPEEWLEKVILKIQNLFLSFNGSMSATGTFGLIQENYFQLLICNLSHPYPILYRNGKANYITQGVHNDPLGNKEFKNLDIISYSLQPNDSLILSSDGKDSIYKTGNLDSSKDFLNLIERTTGDPETMLKFINEKFTLQDDFSILSIRIDD